MKNFVLFFFAGFISFGLFFAICMINNFHKLNKTQSNPADYKIEFSGKLDIDSDPNDIPTPGAV